MSEERSELAEALNRVDQQPAWPIALVGGLASAVMTYVLMSAADWLAVASVLALLAVAAWLTYTARPLPLTRVSNLRASAPMPGKAPALTESARLEVESGIGEPDTPSGVRWIPIPAGQFLMGSEGFEHEQPVHSVNVSAFSCMHAPVTRRQYTEVTGHDPGWPESLAGDRPVNMVSWYDAVRFCNQWSERDGLEVCYRFIDSVTVRWDPERNGYRLPTEAEWEYVCRAGTVTRWSSGDDEAHLDAHAWYDRNSRGQPQPVASKAKNPWGLYDMHGNVWEWCWDFFGDYASTKMQDPQGPPAGRYRVLRGGSFYDSAVFLRSADRGRGRSEDTGRSVGFRCVRGPRRQR